MSLHDRPWCLFTKSSFSLNTLNNFSQQNCRKVSPNQCHWFKRFTLGRPFAFRIEPVFSSLIGQKSVNVLRRSEYIWLANVTTTSARELLRTTTVTAMRCNNSTPTFPKPHTMSRQKRTRTNPAKGNAHIRELTFKQFLLSPGITSEKAVGAEKIIASVRNNFNRSNSSVSASFVSRWWYRFYWSHSTSNLKRLNTQTYKYLQAFEIVEREQQTNAEVHDPCWTALSALCGAHASVQTDAVNAINFWFLVINLVMKTTFSKLSSRNAAWEFTTQHLRVRASVFEDYLYLTLLRYNLLSKFYLSWGDFFNNPYFHSASGVSHLSEIKRVIVIY